jgi:prolyl-tRNA editing enzyme YbaK/EbsC (Cys-tRNA(Pro) deacylase)
MTISANVINGPSYKREVETACKMLKAPAEKSLPEYVALTIQFCVENDIGFILSRNERALSCQDARSKRKRLGHVGIPLWDELKSIVFKGTDMGLREKVIIVHCRGNRKIDTKLLKPCCKLSRKPDIMSADELSNRFGMEYGIVNPFLVQAKWENEIIHVFDKELLTPIVTYPGTMMTNAGNHTWGIEFAPELLIKATDNKIIERVAKPDGEFLY